MRIVKDISYFNDLKLDLYLPSSQEFDVIIYIHGGGLESGDKSEIDAVSSYLLDKNVAIISFNYRMYPSAKYPDYIYDSVNAIKWTLDNIDNYGKSKNIYLVGTSAGAYISMMLCFNSSYFKESKIDIKRIKGYIHNSGQPTVHYNLLREFNLDSKRVIIDEKAPLYYVGLEKEYPRMLFIVSKEDIENRYEQTLLMISTLKSFNYDLNKIDLKVMDGKHCEYVSKTIFGEIIYEFIKKAND